MRRWTEEEEAWLRGRFATEHIGALLDGFEREFGRRPTQRAMEQKCFKLGLRKRPREVPARAVRPIRWRCEPEMQAWMEAHDTGQSLTVLSSQFADAFGFPLSRPQINLWRASNGRQATRSHGGGRKRRPIGAERQSGKGYVLVKVAEEATVPMSKDNWRMKHELVYEREHGKVPEGHVIVFADGDHGNFDPANLVAVPKALMARLNSPDSPEWDDAESLESAVAWCRLHSAIADAEHSLPRTCGVCGRQFRPPEGYRNDARRNCRTCPDCLAKGRKAHGERSVKFVARCAVCGAEFGATQRNQRRCPGCIARRPTWGVGKQKGKDG